MRIAILSKYAKSYSTSRLKQAALARGHKVRVLDPTQFSIHVKQAAPALSFKGKFLPRYDAIVPRIGASETFFGTAVVRQFEQMGTFSLSSSYAIGVSRDKLRALQILSRHDIGLPKSAFARQSKDILPAIAAVGGAPVILKLLEGTQGKGVILADTEKMAEAVIQTLHSANQNVLIQKFVSESKGKDIRAFVVGGRVVAAMRRVAQSGEFRSNVHRGGTTEPVELSSDYVRTAVKAAHILGLQVAGVDLLEAHDGPQVLEVNSSPGLEGIEASSKIDIANSIIEYLEEQVKFPEVDLRQKLTLGKGYEIVEISISRKSELVGKTIEESELDEREIRVLSINRNKVLITNPTGDTVFLPGDVVLCYGKRISLKALIPPDKPRVRKKISHELNKELIEDVPKKGELFCGEQTTDSERRDN